MTGKTTVIVGFGHVARNAYLPLLAKSDTRVRVVDTSEDARADATRIGLDALAELPPAAPGDQAIILSPIPSHLTLAEAAVAHGYHVLVEKPPAPTARTWLDLCARARARGLAVAGAPFTASGRSIETIRRLWGDGSLGQITDVRVDFAKTGPYVNGAVEPRRAWFLGPGAGPARDFGPYPLTLLVGLFGPLQQVAWEVDDTPEAGHVLTGSFSVEGTSVPLHADFRYAEPRGAPPVVITGSRGRLVLDSEMVDGPLLETPPAPGHTPSAVPRSKYRLALDRFEHLITDEAALLTHQHLVGEVLNVLHKLDSPVGDTR
ncbi:Gfo/Idh/MocA family protein [Nocardiopsis tropica]|uniref:Gfo/Idh/MocA family oxidoreductase n=1 Tax=Nocardiopsis tropica TaxID=109330 RepID=A0ABV1ZS07_9ACTN